ncbi:uncharacterized protein [Halyomorpha halys]|uniref:uncharacterized protein n=1 Tax=Halyomorpha halys TaxID=286706 RepID=UPI0034D2B28B
MVSFAASKSMAVMSTMFPHKNVHKETWHSPDSTTASQIDHVLASSNNFNCINDIRSYREYDVNTDHCLIMMKLHQRIKCTAKKQQIRYEQWNTEGLKTEEMVTKFSEKFHELVINGTVGEAMVTSESRWRCFKVGLAQTANEVCGEKARHPRNYWFDEQCVQAIQKRNEKRLMWIS